MTKEERSELYNRIYDEFVQLIKGEIDKVIVSQYEVYELDLKTWFVDIDYQTVRFNNYADVLRDTFINKNIKQTIDMVTGNHVFEIVRDKVGE